MPLLIGWQDGKGGGMQATCKIVDNRSWVSQEHGRNRGFGDHEIALSEIAI